MIQHYQCINIKVRRNLSIGQVLLFPNGVIVMNLRRQQNHYFDIVFNSQNRELFHLPSAISNPFIASEVEVGYIVDNAICLMNLTTKVVRHPNYPELNEVDKLTIKMSYLMNSQTRIMIVPIGLDLVFYTYDLHDNLIHQNIVKDGAYLNNYLFKADQSGYFYSPIKHENKLAQVNPEYKLIDVNLQLEYNTIHSVIRYNEMVLVFITPQMDYSYVLFIKDNQIINKFVFNHFDQPVGCVLNSASVEFCYEFNGTLLLKLSYQFILEWYAIAEIVDTTIKVYGQSHMNCGSPIQLAQCRSGFIAIGFDLLDYFTCVDDLNSADYDQGDAYDDEEQLNGSFELNQINNQHHQEQVQPIQLQQMEQQPVDIIDPTEYAESSFQFYFKIQPLQYAHHYMSSMQFEDNLIQQTIDMIRYSNDTQ